jgi:hypothetical protein
MNGTTLKLARSLERSEGLAELNIVLLLKEIGYAVMASVSSERLWGFVVTEIYPPYNVSAFANSTECQNQVLFVFHLFQV